MDPATALILGSLISTAISGGSEGYKSYKTGQFNKQQKQYQESEQKKAELQARREALSKAIGAGKESSFLGMPKQVTPGPETPNFTFSDIASGVGNAAAQGAMQYYGNKMQPSSATSTPAVTAPKRYDYNKSNYNYAPTRQSPYYG